MHFHKDIQKRFSPNISEKLKQKNINYNLDVYSYLDLENQKTIAPKVVVGDTLKKLELLQLIKSSNFEHIIQGEKEALDAALVHIGEIYESKDLFDFYKKQIKNCEQNILEFSFSSFLQKKELLTLFSNKLPASVETRLGPLLRLVSDELVTNALYNAPLVKIQNKEKFEYNKGQKPSLFFAGLSENRIKLCCLDFFGNLNLQDLIARMIDVLLKGYSEAMSMERTRGAGLGSSIILDEAESLTVLVQPKVATYFEVQIPIHLGNKAREHLNKSIHFLEIKGDLK